MTHNNCVKDLMVTDPIMIAPDATLQEAASKMKSVDCGILPVGTRQELLGVITDRDIVIRAVAAGKDVAQERVADYMSEPVCCCTDQDTLETAATMMRENGVNRLLVKDSKGNACGLLTFGRLLRNQDNRQEMLQVIECAVGNHLAA